MVFSVFKYLKMILVNQMSLTPFSWWPYMSLLEGIPTQVTVDFWFCAVEIRQSSSQPILHK